MSDDNEISHDTIMRTEPVAEQIWESLPLESRTLDVLIALGMVMEGIATAAATEGSTNEQVRGELLTVMSALMTFLNQMDGEEIASERAKEADEEQPEFEFNTLFNTPGTDTLQ